MSNMTHVFFKATGEAPLDMAFSVVIAMRQAITAARADAGNTEWFALGKTTKKRARDYYY